VLERLRLEVLLPRLAVLLPRELLVERERVPVLMHGAGARELGLMGFVDVGASVAAHLGVLSRGLGRSVL